EVDSPRRQPGDTAKQMPEPRRGERAGRRVPAPESFAPPGLPYYSDAGSPGLRRGLSTSAATRLPNTDRYLFSGVTPNTMSNFACNSPTFESLIGSNATVIASRAFGSRTLRQIPSFSLPGWSLT